MENHYTSENHSDLKIDLSPVLEKVRKDFHKLEWDEKRLASAARDYLRFLFLAKTYPTISIAPSHDIDEIWHCHILFTRKYANDCFQHLGFFLHHVPRADDNNTEGDAAVRTHELFVHHFSESPFIVTDEAYSMPCSGCSSCKSCDTGVEYPNIYDTSPRLPNYSH